MKKSIAAVLTAVLAVVSLTGCGDKSNSSSADIPAPAESTPASDYDSEPTTDSTPESIPDDDPNAGADNSALAFPDNKAGRMVKAALSTDAWGYMDIIADQEILNNLIPNLSLDDCEEHCITTCGMSAQLLYAIAIKSKPESEDKVQSALDGFFDNVKNNPDLGFYPAQQESADGAVKGKTNDGYLYVVIHANGGKTADTMTAAN